MSALKCNVLDHVDSTNAIALKYHFSNHIQAPSEKLIFILRNPIECLYSHGMRDKNKNEFEHQLKLYMKNIEYFWACETDKLVLYYEELVCYNTIASISALHTFLGADSNVERYSELISNVPVFLDDAKRALLRLPKSFSSCHYGNLKAES